MNWKRYFNIVNFLAVFAILSASYFVWTRTFGHDKEWASKIFDLASPVAVPAESQKPKHIATPKPVKAIYMTGWVAGTIWWRKELTEFIKKSEINSVVIDVKDYTGRVVFDTDDPEIDALGAEEIRVPDMKEFIEELHNAGIYTIARITVFQDPFYAKKHQDIAVQKKNGLPAGKASQLWKDRKGLSYLDPAAKEFWDYIVRIGKESEKIGFDELNFDYIRFPSDGNMSDISFPVSFKRNKVEVLDEFFAYLNKELESAGVPISADVFGMTTTNYDDLNIGQILENIDRYFDYIAPMVYPSHYPTGFNGIKNPAAHPYEIVLYSMSKAVGRLTAPTSTPDKLRPWLQDFDLGATYDEAKIRAQKKAVYDSGLDSWMIWDPSNKYTRSAYDAE